MTEKRAFIDSHWLPNVPLAASAKTGPYKRTTRAKALDMPLIEANPTCLRSLIVTDVDTSDVRDLACLVGLPAPSWSVIHKSEVATGHVVYALSNPVCMTDAGRRRPVNLLARIETGITDVLGGDVAYAGRIMKNPLAPGAHQYALFGEDYPAYSLFELANSLDLIGALPAFDDPRPRQSSGIGRNVDIFDRTRRWAYRAVKRYWNDGFYTWEEVVQARASSLNLALEEENRPPLPDVEINHLARSIAKWVWGRFTPEVFSVVQAARGKKSGIKRQEKRTKVLQLIDEGVK